MESGRDHEARLQRHGSRINQELAKGEEPVEEPEPHPTGSEPAPTRKATERERIRHQLEHEAGRFAAGEAGRLRDEREADVTRADLDAAAREADRRVGAASDESESRR
jgi:hypothetical protein